MKALSLSVSTPRIGKWRSLATFDMASTISSWVRTGIATRSVQPLAMSVSTRVCTSLPSVFGPPQCSTMPASNRSTSKKPGSGSPQSENVHTGMLRRIAAPKPVRRRRWPSIFARVSLKARSIVAALMVSSLDPSIASRSMCPWRSMAPMSCGSSAFGRLPQSRSEVSQSTTSIARTASS